MLIKKEDLKGLLQKLYQRVVEVNLPIEHLEVAAVGENRWDSDYWTREVIRYLIDGDEKFRRESPPSYLKGNASFVMNQTQGDCDFKVKMVKLLEENKDFGDTYYVCECGWGIDILLGAAVKDWKKIIAYDHNKYMIPEIQKFFDEIGLPVEVNWDSSASIDFAGMKEKTILTGNHIQIPVKKFKGILSNPNLLFIVYGEHLKDYVYKKWKDFDRIEYGADQS